jgi:hypothetical protein
MELYWMVITECTFFADVGLLSIASHARSSKEDKYADETLLAR